MEDIIVLSGSDSDFFKESVNNTILDLINRSGYILKNYSDIKGRLVLDSVSVVNSYSGHLNDTAKFIKDLFDTKRLISICYNANKKTIHLELSFINNV